MLVEFEQTRMVRTILNFVFVFFKKWLSIFDKVLTPFWKTFLGLKQLFDAKIFIQRLSSFSVPKITALRQVCNQIKSCTKHGRPDQSQRKRIVALRDAPLDFKGGSRKFL